MYKNNAAHNPKYMACCVHFLGWFKVESLSYCNWTEFTWKQTEATSLRVCVCCVRSCQKAQTGKTHQDLIQTEYTPHYVKYVKSPIIFGLYPKNIPSTRKQCLRTTWRVNPKYMQFTTPFCPNNTPKALHAVWWFEAAGFLSCAVDFSSLIPSLLEQSCVWRCVC